MEKKFKCRHCYELVEIKDTLCRICGTFDFYFDMHILLRCHRVYLSYLKKQIEAELERRGPTEDKSTVHLLHGGVTLCNFYDGALPRDWPDGHRWVGLSEVRTEYGVRKENPVNCPECLEQLRIADKKQEE